MAINSPKTNKWHEKLSAKLIYNIESCFNSLGKAIAKHPIRTIILTFAFVVLCSFGFVRFHQEKNFIKLWVPQESEFMKHTEWLIDTFKRIPRPEEIIIEGEEVLTPDVLLQLAELEGKIIAAETEDHIKWEDVCFRVPMVSPNIMKMMSKSNKKIDDGYDITASLPSSMLCLFVNAFRKGCYRQSILELWKYDTDVIETLTQEDIIKAISTVTISPVSGHPMNYSQLLGKIKYDENGAIISAKTIFSTWFTDIDFNKVDMNAVGNDFGTADWATVEILSWENVYLDICASARNTLQNLTLEYVAGRSFSDISGSAIVNDVPTLMIGVFAMVLYVLFGISKLNCVEAKVVLAICGLFSILLSIIVACGLSSLFGVFYGPIHTAFPFLMMGLAVDDMFVVAASWEHLQNIQQNQQKKFPLVDKIGIMLEHAGVSITVTSITDFMAFLVGSFTTIPSLRSFCIYAAMGVLATYFYVITFFVACFTLDQRRIEENRSGIIPCIKYKPNEIRSCGSKSYGKIMFNNLYKNIILSTPGKIFVIAITIGMSAFSIERICYLQQRFDPMWFIPQTTYLATFVDSKIENYPQFGLDGFILLGNLNYTHEYPKIKAIVDEMENQTDITITESWIKPFQKYLKRNYNKDIDEITLSEKDWNTYLSKFLFSPGGAMFQRNFKFETDLVCGVPVSKTLASTIVMVFAFEDKPENHIKTMRKLYDISSHANFTTGDKFIKPWSKLFVTWLTDEIIDVELTRNLLLALVCVMFCTMVLIVNLQICFWIFICVLLCILNVCGFMQIWGLTIDIMSCICLTLGTGLCVDYAAHIGYTFITMEGESKHKRALDTVNSIGIAVLHGGISTLIALSSLYFSDCYTFQSFFKIFLLVVLFGQFFGIVLLPVILSLIGPKSRRCHKIVQQTELQ